MITSALALAEADNVTPAPEAVEIFEVDAIFAASTPALAPRVTTGTISTPLAQTLTVSPAAGVVSRVENLAFEAFCPGMLVTVGVRTKTATSLPLTAIVASEAISVSEDPSLSTTESIESK